MYNEIMILRRGDYSNARTLSLPQGIRASNLGFWSRSESTQVPNIFPQHYIPNVVVMDEPV